jgi:predicted XRE-type DNA-binding protein
MYKYNNFPEFKIKVNLRRRINYYIKTRNMNETEAIEYIRSIDKVKNNEPN